jgi:hypothetical protein
VAIPQERFPSAPPERLYLVALARSEKGQLVTAAGRIAAGPMASIADIGVSRLKEHSAERDASRACALRKSIA